MYFTILLLLLSQIFFPYSTISNFVTTQHISLFGWWSSGLIMITYATCFFFIGRWDWLGYYWRHIYIGIVVLLLIMMPLRQEMPTTLMAGETTFTIFINIFMIFIFGTLTYQAWRGRSYQNPHALNVLFPLKDGRFYIAHGGSTSIVNYHTPHRAQRYALDIVALHSTTLRAHGLYPKKLAKYAIFEAPVYSPIDGVIVQMANEQPDLTPPQRDSEQTLGNHVILRPHNTDVAIILAHLQKDSVTVTVGETVKAGQLLGKIGNSGNTTEPHLHIHCATIEEEGELTGGKAIPLLFNGRFLVRNDLMKAT